MYVSIFLLAIVALGSAAQCSYDQRRTIDPINNCGYDYDFIVVGGGTAGAIAATRIANAGNYTVLLIESGPKVYEDSIKSLDLLLPILTGLELPLEDLVDTLKEIFNNPIPAAANLTWLATTLDSTLSNLLPGLVPKAKRAELLGGLVTVVGGLLGTSSTGTSSTTGSSSTTGASTTGSSTPEINIRGLLQSLIENLVEGVASLIPNIQETPLLSIYVPMSEASHYYTTTPQLFGQKREIEYPRGNLLGGCSGTNQMVYFRGSKRDFDTWENEYGLEGWGYDDILKYFKVFENNEDVPDTQIHGHSGPINITLSVKQFKNPAAEAFLDSAWRLGWPNITDASDPNTTYGASYWQTFVGSNGRRSDSTAYIRLLDKRGKVCWNKPKTECGQAQTLHIWTETFVTKVIFEGTRAVGVEYSRGVKSQARSESPYFPKSANEGVKHHSQYNKWDRTTVQATAERLGCPASPSLAFNTKRPADQYVPLKPTSYNPLQVRACREVILSAGTVGTAQLLMLSGIGSAEHLKSRSIPVRADLNVGRHTQDHQELFAMYKVPPTYDPGFNVVTEVASGFKQFTNFFEGRRGFLSANNIPAGVDGSSEGVNGTIPTYHLHFLTVGAFESFDNNMAQYLDTVLPPHRLPRNIFELLLLAGLYRHSIGCELSGNHAYGTIELRSSDPFCPPFVDPRFGSSDEDNRELVECLKAGRKIVANMDKKARGEELKPTVDAKTDEELLQVVINNVWGHHISSSAPMGNCSDPYSVTDGKGRVRKVDGLRVVDMSLFPTIPHGNPAAVVMMLAEKLAHDILKDHNIDQWPPAPL